MPVILRFQSTGVVPGNARPVTMNGTSLTIGRGEENDLVLPDPDRQISKRHCAIEEQDGHAIVIDFSTNGTFLNYGKTPLGRVPTPLNDGDILTMGPYELLVEVTAAQGARGGAAIPAPFDEPSVPPPAAGRGFEGLSPLDDLGSGQGGGDFLDDLLGGSGPSGPSGIVRPGLGDDGLLPPLGEDEADDFLAPAPAPDTVQGASHSAHSPAMEDHFQTPSRAASAIPDDWDDDFLGGPDTAPVGDEADPFAAPPPDALASPAFIPEDPLDDDLLAPVPAPEAPKASPAPPSAERVSVSLAVAPAVPANAGGDAAARAFLDALGAGHLQVSDAELAPIMSRLGGVLRVMIEGLREILMTRSSIKSEFRISQTVISAGGNNPLKFSISPEQAIDAMVKPATKGYLAPDQAAEQALRDIKAHEVAMMTGMEAALKGVLKRLDPALLEGKIETSGGFGSILKGKKARYWEVYEKMYAEISDQAENDFHELFSKEFARAYQDQLERLK